MTTHLLLELMKYRYSEQLELQKSGVYGRLKVYKSALIVTNDIYIYILILG